MLRFNLPFFEDGLGAPNELWLSARE